jgi:DNA-binding IclR family transcriptional regulator
VRGVVRTSCDTIMRKDLAERNIRMDKAKKTAAISSISRAATILSCISDGINSSSEISEYSKLSKSTVHRLLNALVEARLIIHDPVHHNYSMGELIAKLISRPQITHDYLIGCAHDEMKHLLNFAGETVNLSIMIGIKHTSLHVVPSKNDLRVVEEIREINSVHAGAAGKVLLSQLSDKELKIVMKNIKLEPITEYSTTDKDELLFQLKRIKQQGYSICANERIIGAMGISAPVSDYIMPVALSIVGPEVRMKPRSKELIEALLASASRISGNIKENYPTT